MQTCPCCDKPVTPGNIEPTFRKPQAFIELSREARAACITSSEVCVIDNKKPSERFFVRAVMPASVLGRERPLNWGVWVEFPDFASLKRYDKLERDPAAAGATFNVTLANRVPGYPDTVGLPGTLTLGDNPNHRARFSPEDEAPEDEAHQLVEELSEPVPEHRVHEWMHAMAESGGG